MIYISQVTIEDDYQAFIGECFNRNLEKTIDWHGTKVLRIKDGKEKQYDGVWKYYQLPLIVSKQDYNAVMALAEYVKTFVSHDEKYQFLHYVDITLYPQGVSKPFHFDVARYTTTGSSITYLNDNFVGGQTVIGGVSVQPLVGRTVYFDGKADSHCVMDVVKGNRYTLSTWYGTEPAEELHE
jgi:hypothetical protein